MDERLRERLSECVCVREREGGRERERERDLIELKTFAGSKPIVSTIEMNLSHSSGERTLDSVKAPGRPARSRFLIGSVDVSGS